MQGLDLSALNVKAEETEAKLPIQDGVLVIRGFSINGEPKCSKASISGTVIIADKEVYFTAEIDDVIYDHS